ncbi:hypothetical protein EBZ80_20800 [bacterium]|nr:hypothetical protein [Betaproteobacteria bacterium]NDE17368.1 hypothetical protein [bacterium]
MQEAWKSRETFASVLLTLYLDRFGVEALDWDPATITLEVEEEFDVELPQLSLDKLLVAIQILTSDRFFKNLPDFISFCNVLGGDTYRPDMWDPADAEEVAWGITEALLISPPDDSDPEPFTDEIRAYIGAVLDSEGIINAPDILRIALRAARVSPNIADFSDDPTMFNAVYDLEAGKTEDINQSIRLKTDLLVKQLTALDLQNGNTKYVVELLQNSASS